MLNFLYIWILVSILIGPENNCCRGFPSQQNSQLIPVSNNFWIEIAKANNVSKPKKVTVTPSVPVTFAVPALVAPGVHKLDAPPIEANVESSIAAAVVETAPPASDAAAPVVVVPSASIIPDPKYPCKCKDLKCSCCSVFLETWKQKGCANVRFLPEEFAMEMKLTMNGDSLFTRKVTARDPPPICFNPRRFPLVDICARLYNIRIKDRSAQVCVDIDASIGGFNLYERSFDCLKFGPQGILTGQKPFKVKPSKIPAVNLFENNDDDSEEYFGDGDFDIFDY